MIKTFTQGIFSSASDLMLAAIHFNLTFSPPASHINPEEEKIWQSFTKLKFSTLKRSLIHLKAKKFIKTDKQTSMGYSLTSDGLEYINFALPHYQSERFWSNEDNLYLVVYDFPVTKNADRNALRYFLKSIGCRLLQHSVWVSIHNPKPRIEKFLARSNINPDLIIVSSLNLDEGTIGKTRAEIIDSLYDLKFINAEYADYLLLVDQTPSREYLIFKYLSILKKDPQPPFELLLSNWQGANAHHRFLDFVSQ